MDVAPAMDFDFNLSSYGYTSAPSSPTRLTELYNGLDELLISSHAERNSCIVTVPFAWEEKPGVPKTPENLFDDDFSFDVSSHFNKDSVSAEDLFHGGVIKTIDSPSHKVLRERGRERGFLSSSRLSSRSRRTRSLSPLGASDHCREQIVTPSTASSSENGFKKWSFMDFFLFRSASDGRAMDKDPLKKYSENFRKGRAMDKDPLKKYSENFRKHDHDVRNSGSMSKRRGRVSAHELHYNVNRAVSNDMKKKTYLPYKQGILGRFSFNP